MYYQRILLERGCTTLLVMLSAMTTLQGAELALRSASHRTLNINPSELGGVAHYGANHTTYFLHTERGVVHRIGDNERSLTSIQLQPPPEAEGAAMFYSDIAVDATGRMFVAATWTRKPRGGGAGVLVYDAQGNYERSIVLSPRTNIRHLALDKSGNIFVLGVDPSYFKGASNLCLLVHKYGPDGKRLTAFSGCPIPPNERTESRWRDLNFEVDRGSLWLEDGKLYQVLPVSRLVRVFEPQTGMAVAEVSLRPPQSEEVGSTTTGPGIAWRVISRGHDGFLVVWSATTDSGRTSYVTAHDQSGVAIASWRNPFTVGMPVATATNGQVLVLAPERDGTVGLLRGVVETQ